MVGNGTILSHWCTRAHLYLVSKVWVDMVLDVRSDSSTMLFYIGAIVLMCPNFLTTLVMWCDVAVLICDFGIGTNSESLMHKGSSLSNIYDNGRWCNKGFRYGDNIFYVCPSCYHSILVKWNKHIVCFTCFFNLVICQPHSTPLRMEQFDHGCTKVHLHRYPSPRH